MRINENQWDCGCQWLVWRETLDDFAQHELGYMSGDSNWGLYVKKTYSQEISWSCLLPHLRLSSNQLFLEIIQASGKRCHQRGTSHSLGLVWLQGAALGMFFFNIFGAKGLFSGVSFREGQFLCYELPCKCLTTFPKIGGFQPFPKGIEFQTTLVSAPAVKRYKAPWMEYEVWTRFFSPRKGTFTWLNGLKYK